MSDQTKPNIVVGIGGGVAAYKACYVIRSFTETGANVRVVPTANALKFVGVATLEALSGNSVSTTVFNDIDEVAHVKIGQEADGIVIAPATADLMARLAAGRADDLLTATVLVATCPVLIVPAMHTEMWANPATQANVARLRSYGYTVMEPAHGRLTGKESGPGRLPEPEQIANLARTLFKGHRLEHTWEGRRVVITAGGTQENLDPVRYIGNRSSGRQGYALAEAASQRGARVTLIAGDTDELPIPCGVEVVKARSARRMLEAVEKHVQDADIAIMAAAVSDYRPAREATSKMKKGSAGEENLKHVEMVENPDILRTVVKKREAGELPRSLQIVGFAAETGDETHAPLEYGREKLARKGCDMLMCNDVSDGGVFGALRNSGWLLHKDGGEEAIPEGTKLDVAAEILTAIDELNHSLKD